VKLAGDFVQKAGTLLQYTGKKFAIFNDHCILTCEVNRQLKNSTDSNLNVWASNAVVITCSPLGLENALECYGEQLGGFEIMDKLCIFSTSTDKFEDHFLYCMELRFLVPMFALFASLWLAPSEKENVELWRSSQNEFSRCHLPAFGLSGCVAPMKDDVVETTYARRYVDVRHNGNVRL
jgi:hypothetical protein